MDIKLELNLPAKSQDWNIYWRIKMEDPTTMFSDVVRKMQLSRIPKEVMDMEITPEIKERVLKMAREYHKKLSGPVPSSVLKWIRRTPENQFGRPKDRSQYSARLSMKRKGSRDNRIHMIVQNTRAHVKAGLYVK